MNHQTHAHHCTVHQHEWRESFKFLIRLLERRVFLAIVNLRLVLAWMSILLFRTADVFTRLCQSTLLQRNFFCLRLEKHLKHTKSVFAIPHSIHKYFLMQLHTTLRSSAFQRFSLFCALLPKFLSRVGYNEKTDDASLFPRNTRMWNFMN